MYLVIPLLVLRAGCGIWLYQFLIIAYLFLCTCNTLLIYLTQNGTRLRYLPWNTTDISFHVCLCNSDRIYQFQFEVNGKRRWTNKILTLIISPEPKAHWWAYRLGRPPASVCLSSVVHTLLTSSPQKALNRLKPNFIWSLHGIGERKYVQTALVTWPRWPPCPYILKTFKNDDFWHWYATSGTRVLPNLFKWWPWVDLDLFYGKVKFGPLCLCMGKS